MDPDLIAYLDQRFRENAEQISSLREETTQQISSLRKETLQRFEQVDRRFEQVEDTTRQTLILVEGLRSEVHLIAEGFLGLSDKIERWPSEAVVFDTAKGWIEPYYRDLDNRVRILEGRAERQQGDVLDAVRKMLGKPPLASPVTD